MSRARIAASFAAGLTGFAAGFYLALASVLAVSGLDDVNEVQLELTAIVFGAVISTVAVAVSSGAFKTVIGRVAATATASAAGAGAALVMIESGPVALAIAGAAIVAAEVTAAWLVA